MSYPPNYGYQPPASSYAPQPSGGGICFEGLSQPAPVQAYPAAAGPSYPQQTGYNPSMYPGSHTYQQAPASHPYQQAPTQYSVAGDKQGGKETINLEQKVAEIFLNEPEQMYRVLYFLVNPANEQWRRALEAAFTSNRDSFVLLARQLENNTRKIQDNSDYRQDTRDICDKLLTSSKVVLSDHGQQWATSGDAFQFGTITAYNMVDTVSRLPKPIQTKIMDVIPYIMDKCFGISGIDFSLMQITVYLAASVISNIRKWWIGEISGERCAKNVVDAGVSIAASMGGGTAGAAVGSICGLPCMVIGGLVGGIAGTLTAYWTIDRLTQWFFGLPKDVALENSYRFLGVAFNASNDAINKQFKMLCLKYHPDKGGQREDWDKLQLSMAIIKEARGGS